MLGYIALAGAWGMAKAIGHGAKRTHLTVDGGELLEELQFRTGIERLGLRGLLGVAPGPARFASALLFGLDHPGNELDASLGGILYSYAYDEGGLLGATLCHLAHNLGVWLGGRP